MSPRSEELFEKGRRRLAAAHLAVDAGATEAAVSSAYYAMLYVARAALSERNLYAKTHSGVWSEFGRALVSTGVVEADLGRLGSTVQKAREEADYDAEDFTVDEASAIVADAERFIEAVETLLARE